MLRQVHPLFARILILLLFSFCPDARAQVGLSDESERPPDARLNPHLGPGGVYARIPARDDLGRDQLAMFRTWNPDPIGHHEANIRALNPVLARVILKVQADNPRLTFVIGSGKRDAKLQRKAVAWGWSRTQGSPHRTGDAVDLWPLDQDGRVYFDPGVQTRIAEAVAKAAAALGVPVRWGGHFHGFKDMDRSHFELSSR
ncbi:M15 family metallopeptidase [Microvirga terrae]|uniref:M15 family metallopeptidase n=1 Tax=Microvirga terrae TaxID=2740529 RepID=A0ABY5RTU8_9HYPH|nr:M15 family metallopeptidase [Microvirga terrae]UVF20690.1 M15 family metallopeptidase [Microvirga terrae]